MMKIVPRNWPPFVIIINFTNTFFLFILLSSGIGLEKGIVAVLG